MKVTEARSAYGAQIKQYQEQKNLLTARKQQLEKLAKHSVQDAVLYEKELSVIEQNYEKLEEKQNEYQEYLGRLAEFETAYANLLSTKQQGDAVAEAYEDIGKIMEVARRIMKGDIVPTTDERKLMEYSNELYQAAKNIGELMRQKEREEHKSLWEEEEETQEEVQDPMEAAGEMEAPAGPAMETPAEVICDTEA